MFDNQVQGCLWSLLNFFWPMCTYWNLLLKLVFSLLKLKTSFSYSILSVPGWNVSCFTFYFIFFLPLFVFWLVISDLLESCSRVIFFSKLAALFQCVSMFVPLLFILVAFCPDYILRVNKCNLASVFLEEKRDKFFS